MREVINLALLEEKVSEPLDLTIKEKTKAEADSAVLNWRWCANAEHQR